FEADIQNNEPYQIKCKHWSRQEQLHMLLTGPGGTGKSHVVGALHALMSRYGKGHLLRFLAPTGSAAANIDGMTVHKAFGL
ncbi:hypothetical protein BJ138DRAFT_977510, partial [Hygrophoropsis aurantiaca]